MIEGIVANGIEVIVRLEMMSAQGEAEVIAAIVDTGFTSDLTLPPSAYAIWATRRYRPQ